MSEHNRRRFLRNISLGGILILGSRQTKAKHRTIHPNSLSGKKFGANDQIRLGIIGCGIQGLANARTAAGVSGLEVAAACDLYTGRLDRMKEVFGEQIKTTRDYREVLNSDDIDAVCIATSDHWHDHMMKEALAAGKAVYCEKPMMHKIEEGHSMVEAEKKYGLPVQIGSQRASAIETIKAKELFEQGIIGQLILADIRYDRANSNGAWQYSIPTDASEETVDWEAFLGDAPKRDFDKVRFFRWRNYADYGTGVAGDLFVHLFTALHVVTSSLGPEKIYATGGLRFWKDGRDAPDLTLGLYDYAACEQHPAFNVQMRVNFADGSGGGSHVRLIGTEGVMTLSWGKIIIERKPVDTMPTYGGWDSYETFSASQKQSFEAWFKKEYGKKKFSVLEPPEMTYSVPDGYSDHHDHWAGFADAIRNGTPLVENAQFGMRAAGPALATNVSMQKGQAIGWNPADCIITEV